MKKSSLVLIGGGGHCKSCIDVVESEGKFAIEGILDAVEIPGTKICGYEILGNDNLIEELAGAGHLFLITVGQIKSAKVRVAIFEKLLRVGAQIATSISSKAHLSSHATIGAGSIVLHGSIVNANAHIGKNAIVNSSALIEHDVVIGSHVHISTGALINGGCIIGDNTFIGSGSVIANNVSIAANVVVGAGSLVLNDITLPGMYAGSPAKLIRNEG